MSHRYRGHRANSFSATDPDELVELHARQRTFHGAYSRTALGNLCYSLVILRLFDRKFYGVGLLYAILAGMLFVFAFLRARHSRHDFADCYRDECQPALCTVGQEGRRIFGRPFVTAGWVVVSVSVVVAIVEIVLLILVLSI